MATANTTSSNSEHTQVGLGAILAELTTIQAMVAASRHTVGSINDTDADHACVLLSEADSRLFALRLKLEEGGGEA